MNARDLYLPNVPSKVRGVMRKAFEGTSSPRQAIKAKCLACSNFDSAEISFCRVVLCPLWAFRPYQRDDSGKGAP